MQRRKFLRTAGVGAAAAAAGGTVAAPAIAQSAPELNWRMTSSFPKSLDTLYGGAELFAKIVAEATDNKFQIRTFAAGEIVPGLQVLDAVQNGTVEMGQTASYYFCRQGSDLRAGDARPVRPQHAPDECVVNRGGGASSSSTTSSRTTTSIGMPCGNTGGQMGGWFRKEIKTRRRPQGSEDAHRRPGRRRDEPSSAWCRSRSPAATSIRRSRRARSMPPSGSVPMTTRSSAS